MQFETFKTRRITLKRASRKDLREYQQQVVLHNTTQDKLNIMKNCETGYVKIENEDGKMLGLIQVDRIDENTAHVKISIPNESWKEKYGKEALHQFLKCCRERKLYRRVYLKQENSIVKDYKKERPKLFEKGFYIDIDVA